MRHWWRVEFSGIWSETAEVAIRERRMIRAGGWSSLSPGGTVQRQGNTVWLVAEGESDALAQVRRALEEHGTFGNFVAAPFDYLAYLGVSETEAAALESAREAMLGLDPRISSIVVSEPSDGSAEVLFELPAANPEDALAQAEQLYAGLRERAGLPPARALYGFIGNSGLFPPTARHRQLRSRARELLDNGIYDLAVVVAQTGCEIYMFEAIEELVGRLDDGAALSFTRDWLAKNKDRSLSDERVRDLWTTLTGDKVQTQGKWWAAYKAHLTRRHGVVHYGYPADRKEAEASLAATDAFTEHAEAVMHDARL